jgi:hypothetical protein
MAYTKSRANNASLFGSGVRPAGRLIYMVQFMAIKSNNNWYEFMHRVHKS